MDKEKARRGGLLGQIPYGEIGDWKPIIVRRILRGDVSSVIRACLDRQVTMRQVAVACSAALLAHAQLLAARLLRRDGDRRSLELRLRGLYRARAGRRSP